MKIELTKNQYKTLLTLRYCGEWVVNSHKTSVENLSEATDDLEKLVFTFAKENGLEKCIEYNESMKMFFSNRRHGG